MDESKPNVLVIFYDDMGYGDPGSYLPTRFDDIKLMGTVFNPDAETDCAQFFRSRLTETLCF